MSLQLRCWIPGCLASSSGGRPPWTGKRRPDATLRTRPQNHISYSFATYTPKPIQGSSPIRPCRAVIYCERELGTGLFLVGSPAIPTNFDVPLRTVIWYCVAPTHSLHSPVRFPTRIG